MTLPVRILWGQEDRWQPTSYAERLAADIPHAELVVVPGAGHFLMEDDPARVTQEVLDFLADAKLLGALAASPWSRSACCSPTGGRSLGGNADKSGLCSIRVPVL